MVRHKSFKLMQDLRSGIEEYNPSDIYYSTAYYRHPELDMAQKGWEEADLVFDIDADHLKAPCKLDHSLWVCNACKQTEIGVPPKSCQRCSAAKIEEIAWMCDICLGVARDEVARLIDFLNQDFGIESEKMEVVFSGHRGYHLHVRSDLTSRLDDEARKEIVDYVIGLGLDPQMLGLSSRSSTILERLAENDSAVGWRKRLFGALKTLFETSTDEELFERGFTKREVRRIKDWRERRNRQPFGALITEPRWREVLIRIIETLSLSVNVDPVVTTDIHRLIRMPETLNGKTGFRAVTVNYQNLESFDPFSSAISFEGRERVHVIRSPQFRLGSAKFGPFQDELVELPLAGAVLLCAKGLAYPVD